MQLESIMPELTVDLVLRFLASFLLGSIPFALIAMIGSGVDIRTIRFNGGKGIAASTGVMLVLYPALALGCIVLYVLLRTLGRKLKWPEEGALASLICWALFAVAVYFLQGPSIAALAAVMFAIVTWRHRDNLQRLVSGAQTS